MKKSIYSRILGENMPLKDKVFRLALIAGTVVSLVLTMERLVIRASMHSIFLAMFLLLVVIVALFMTFKMKHTSVASFFLGMMLDLFILPMTYFFCGGIRGGAVIWMILGIGYWFVFSEGKLLFFLVCLTLSADAAAIIGGIYHPELIMSFPTERGIYCDLIFALLGTGCCIGAILLFQRIVYDEERKLTQKQKDELEKVNDAKMRFFSNMSNELRTPISNIIELNEILLREEISDEAKEDAVHIQKAGKMLLSYVNDILDCAKLESGKITLEYLEYDTQKMVSEIVEAVSYQAKKNGLEFVVKIDNNLPRQMIGDEKRMKQIIMNLLVNSIRTTAKGAVTLEVFGERIGGEWVKLHIQVSDTGSGVRKEELEYLFESYKKISDDHSISMDGSGIGLTICKQLVNLMGGKITVDSIFRKGTTYTVTLEQRIANPDEIGFLNTRSRSKEVIKNIYRHSFEAPEARILVVDDNEMNLMIFEKYMRYTKVQIDTVTSGAECLKSTYNKFYNIIFLDYMMPEMNGVETLAHIRKQENGMCRETPIIAMNSESIQGGEKTYLELGFTSFLEKPLMGMTLENKVLQYLPDDIVEFRREVLNPENTIIQGNAKTKRRVLITSDSVCDISEELAGSVGVKIFYLYIKTAKGRFLDTKELASDNLSVFGDESLYDTVLDSASVEEYEEFFAEALTEAEEVIHISLGEKAGKSYHNSVSAATGFDHVHIIDSGQISCGQGILVLYASRLAKQGRSVNEIIAEVDRMKEKISTGFVTRHVENLYRKGYASDTTRRIFGIFNLRPLIRLPHGTPKVSGFYTGDLESAYRKLVHAQLKNKKNIDTTILFVSYVGVPSRILNQLLEEIKKEIRFEKVVVSMASASNTCGAGIGTFGFSYFTK